MSDRRTPPSASTDAAATARRRDLLLRALRHLQPSGDYDGARLDAALAQALDQAPSPAGNDLLAQLVQRLQRVLQQAGLASSADPARAIAQALMAQASDDIAREALRAGHADTFAALGPWLQQTLPAADAIAMGQRLGRTPDDLQRALARLRRRFRQRVDAGLALWSADAGQRTRLRRQLHAALSSGEPQQ